MKNFMLALTLASSTATASDGDKPEVLLAKKYGNEELSKVVVESVPGTVSAMSMLGIAVDQTTVVQNPRNLTIALKALDGKNALGLSFTPARTSIMPLNISTYNDNIAARIWGNTTFSFAQGKATVNSKDFERRAFAVETSFFLYPHSDDPFVMYWDDLAAAALKPDETKNVCLIMRENKPNGEPGKAANVPAPAPGAATVTLSPGETTEMQVDPEVKKASDPYAEKCRANALTRARWNATRAWISWAAGQYRPADGGDSHSLGKTFVAGLTWGFGSANAKTAAALTISGKRTIDSPIQKTMGDAAPKFASNTLALFRIAVGSPTWRVVAEGSNVTNSEPTASDRTYKRALGFDVNIHKNWWLIFRGGRQRKIDNSGDETGSSFNFSYSPDPALKL